MQDRSSGQETPRGSRGRRLTAGLALLLVLGGGTSAAWWASHHGWLTMPVMIGSGSGTPADDTASQAAAAAVAVAANSAASDAALAATSAKVSALEQRLAELNQQANAASGQATRAEALLLAFAARRAIERGQPLGILENQLRVRFGADQPGAVDRVIAAAAHPVTLGSLAEEFAALEPRLTGASREGGTWTWISAQVSSLFVIRHDEGPDATPASRRDHARLALAGGRVDAAISDVEHMPGKDAATEWLAHARDWVSAQHALDQLETAALLLPGPEQRQAQQPQPAPSPTPEAEATPGPVA